MKLLTKVWVIVEILKKRSEVGTPTLEIKSTTHLSWSCVWFPAFEWALNGGKIFFIIFDKHENVIPIFCLYEISYSPSMAWQGLGVVIRLTFVRQRSSNFSKTPISPCLVENIRVYNIDYISLSRSVVLWPYTFFTESWSNFHYSPCAPYATGAVVYTALFDTI